MPTSIATQIANRIIQNRKESGVIPVYADKPKCGKFVELRNDIIGYKNVRLDLEYESARAVVAMIIPAGTIVFKAGMDDDYKCRAEKAIVVKITKSDGKEVKKAYSLYTTHQKFTGQVRSKYQSKYHFVYTPMTTVYPVRDFSFLKDACMPGIHFFPTYNEALCYSG
jgi:hypothetical protein